MQECFFLFCERNFLKNLVLLPYVAYDPLLSFKLHRGSPSPEIIYFCRLGWSPDVPFLCLPCLCICCLEVKWHEELQIIDRHLGVKIVFSWTWLTRRICPEDIPGGYVRGRPPRIVPPLFVDSGSSTAPSRRVIVFTVGNPFFFPPLPHA